MAEGRSRPPVFALVLMGVLALGAVLLIGDAVLSAVRNVGVAVSAADGERPGATFDEFGAHPLHQDVAVPDAACALPEFDRADAVLAAYYTALVECMDDVWRPVMEEVGLDLDPPTVVTAEDPGLSECTMTDDNYTAWYCISDATMYLPISRMTEWDGGRPDSHLAVVAHEYAHHLQASGGLLELAYLRLDRAPEGSAEALDIERRIELQANCLAGVFIGAAGGQGDVPQHVASGAVDGFVHTSGVSTHGSERNQARWAALGYRERTLSACNTWAAPADDVSD